MLIKKLFGKRHPKICFIISNNNYNQEVQIILHLKSIQLLPLRSVLFLSCSANQGNSSCKSCQNSLLSQATAKPLKPL